MFVAFLLTLMAVTTLHPCSAEPLLLTSFLERGEIQAARDASKVQTDIVPLSYSGFLTVDKHFGNHLFFWFFPSQENSKAPLLLWFNGGPGVSSMLGLLLGHGPIELIHANNSIGVDYQRRKSTWVGPFSVLYVDQPVGVGYSFSDKGRDGYKTSQEGYTEDMYSFVQQFFVMFPEHLDQDFYIGGQSYAGRYVPALAHRIHLEKQKGKTGIPLTGIYLGGPYFDPEVMAPVFFDFLHAFGVLSHADNVYHQDNINEVIRRYRNGHFKNETMNTVHPFLVPQLNVKSLVNFVSGDSPDYQSLTKLMTSSSVRQLIHVGSNLDYVGFDAVFFSLFGQDVLRGTKPELAVLMDNYKVLIYTGDYDVIVSNLMVEASLLTTPWSLQGEYNQTSRKVWNKRNSKGQKYGFYSKTGKFCRVVVRAAGHQTPYDQPEICLQMMKDFVQYGCVNEGQKPKKQRKPLRQEEDTYPTIL